MENVIFIKLVLNQYFEILAFSISSTSYIFDKEFGIFYNSNKENCIWD